MSCETEIWLLPYLKRRPRHTDGKSTVIKSLCRIVTIFNTMSEKGIMYAAFHRFYGTLQNLQKFSIDNNLIDNIVSLDNFFSAFRSTSFVLQSSVAHTDYKTLYEEMCSERLKPNSICKWMVETRNEIEKQHPFDLSKQAFVTVYSPTSAMILKSDVFTVVNDVEYVSLVESLKDYLNKINPIEVHFSLEFKFKKLDDDTDLSSDISSAIATMKSFLFDMYAKIGETTELCEDLKSKIESLISEILKDELIFIDDYVFYGEDNRFERGQRFIPSFPKYIPVRQCAQTFGARFPTDDPKEFMKLIAKSHLEIFKAQGGNLMPTVFVVNKQNMCRVVSFDSTIRTTAYRIINDIARQVVTEKIKYVVLIHEGYLYKDFKNHNLPYDKRIEHSKGRAVVVEQVGDGFVPRAMIFDVARLSDRQYVNDMLKCKYDIKFIAQFSILKPIHQEIMLRRSSQGK